jgi:hypothetical protein
VLCEDASAPRKVDLLQPAIPPPDRQDSAGLLKSDGARSIRLSPSPTRDDATPLALARSLLIYIFSTFINIRILRLYSRAK